MKNSSPESKVADFEGGPPTGYFVIANPSAAEAGIDVVAVVTAAIKQWKWLLAAALVGALATALIVLNLPNKYAAQVLVAPVKNSASDGTGGLRSQMGGLAALAGIDLGGGGRVEESFATLSSRGFARQFIESNNLLPVLFYKRWDASRNAWNSNAKVPTLEDGVGLFLDQIRSVSEDKKTHLITIRIESTSPATSADWANGLVDMVNERLRQDAIRDAEQNIKYLKEELDRTNVVELKQAIYRLMEAQVNQAMLANVQRQYAFRVLDKAVPPEKKVSPKRTVTTLAGGMAAMLLVFIGLSAYNIFRSGRDRGEPA